MNGVLVSSAFQYEFGDALTGWQQRVDGCYLYFLSEPISAHARNGENPSFSSLPKRLRCQGRPRFSTIAVVGTEVRPISDIPLGGPEQLTTISGEATIYWISSKRLR